MLTSIIAGAIIGLIAGALTSSDDRRGCLGNIILGLAGSWIGQSLLNLGFMIDYFSEKGYYLKAGTLAEEIKNFPHHAKHFLVRELCLIEMRAVYNLLRQNDKSAIPRARNIIAYLEADTNLIPTEANMRRLIEFREIFNKLNKTGIDLTDPVGHRY